MIGKNYQKGIDSEIKTINYLKSQGYEILASRFKTSFGEIDILAKHEDTIIGIEVKYRKSIESAAYSINTKQKSRIIDAMNIFLQDFIQENQIYPFIRFDVVLLSSSKEMNHIKNAWTSDE
jgi:putative endonuclease